MEKYTTVGEHTFFIDSVVAISTIDTHPSTEKICFFEIFLTSGASIYAEFISRKIAISERRRLVGLVFTGKGCPLCE